MKILAIDTSAAACSVALCIGEEMIASHVLAPMQQAKLILPMINEVLLKSGYSLQDLDALAFGCGPGSFTGVRIAASVMQGLAFATQIPLIKISSLAAIAQAVYNDFGWQHLMVAIDARMNEVYWGAYQLNVENNLVQLLGKEHVTPPAHLLFPKPANWAGVGNAWRVYHNLIDICPEVIDENCLPMATAIAQLAKEKHLSQDWVTLPAAMPVYLRDTVAIKSAGIRK
jgi:tRNA threonylcarbamoyladenosine biosynthesis protein TsaB